MTRYDQTIQYIPLDCSRSLFKEAKWNFRLRLVLVLLPRPKKALPESIQALEFFFLRFIVLLRVPIQHIHLLFIHFWLCPCLSLPLTLLIHVFRFVSIMESGVKYSLQKLPYPVLLPHWRSCLLRTSETNGERYDFQLNLFTVNLNGLDEMLHQSSKFEYLITWKKASIIKNHFNNGMKISTPMRMPYALKVNHIHGSAGVANRRMLNIKPSSHSSNISLLETGLFLNSIH